MHNLVFDNGDGILVSVKKCDGNENIKYIAIRQLLRHRHPRDSCFSSRLSPLQNSKNL